MTYTITHYKLKKTYALVTFNEEVMNVPLDVFYRYHMKVGLIFDHIVYQEILNDIDYANCKHQALKLLRVPKTTYELKEKLSTYKKDIITQIIKELTDKGYVNDDAYMKLYHELRPSVGPKKLKFTFRNKGISFERIDTFLNTIDESASLEMAFEKVLKKTTKKSYSKSRESIYQYLMNQGFSSSLIMSKLDHHYSKDDGKEKELLRQLFYKTLPKLQGNSYEKCQKWVKKALSKGFLYQDAKSLCEDINFENMD
mgnify:CR=1 FL=1